MFTLIFTLFALISGNGLGQMLIIFMVAQLVEFLLLTKYAS